MSRVSNDRLQELIEWYADDCNAYTEQHDRDIQRALTELLNLRLADQPSVEHIVAHTDERVSMTLAQYRQLTANQPEAITATGTADQQSVSPTGDKGTIQPDDDISMQESPQPVDGTGKQSMQACTRNEAGLVQQCEDCEPYDEPHGPHCRSHPDYDGAPKE
jgi:hypothetical protein